MFSDSGVGKRWFIDSLISAAQRRSVSYFELYNQRSLTLIEQRLRQEALLVIDWENLLIELSAFRASACSDPPSEEQMCVAQFTLLPLKHKIYRKSQSRFLNSAVGFQFLFPI